MHTDTPIRAALSYPLSRRLRVLRNTIRDAAEPSSPIDDLDAIDAGLRIVGTVYGAPDAGVVVRPS